MVKTYVMSTCPDCAEVIRAVKNDPRFQMIDIGEHVRDLKEFMRLRDVHPKFEVVRRRGAVGIPSFVKEDGTITFKLTEIGLELASKEIINRAACNLNGSGC